MAGQLGGYINPGVPVPGSTPVQPGQITSGLITSGAIASGQVGSFHLSSGAVISERIASGQVWSFHLSSGAVTSGAIASGQIGSFHIGSGQFTGFELGSGAIVSGRVASGSIGFGHIANAAIQSGCFISGTIGWPHKTGGTVRVAADIPVTDTTFVNITGLSIPLPAAGKYVGQAVIKCINTTAAEGIKFDFNGGTATVTSFWAAAFVSVGGTTVIGAAIATALNGVINFTTITGESLIIINISILVDQGGSLQMRFAENTTAVGTTTVRLGSFMQLTDAA